MSEPTQKPVRWLRHILTAFVVPHWSCLDALLLTSLAAVLNTHFVHAGPVLISVVFGAGLLVVVVVRAAERAWLDLDSEPDDPC